LVELSRGHVDELIGARRSWVNFPPYPLRLPKYPSAAFLTRGRSYAFMLCGSHEPNACNLTARSQAVTRDLARLPRAMRLAS
jgi:hypothetical protein